MVGKEAMDAIRMERAEAKPLLVKLASMSPDAIRMERAEAKRCHVAKAEDRHRCNPHGTC